MKTRGILGISEEHDAGIALIDRGRFVFAANEERYSRVKFQIGTPTRALARLGEFLTRQKRLFPQEVAVASTFHVESDMGDWFSLNWPYSLLDGILSQTKLERWLWGTPVGAKLLQFLGSFQQLARKRKLVKLLKAQGIASSKISFIDHHLAHAASVYYSAPWKNCLVITQDASGDGWGSRVFVGRGGKLTPVHAVPFFHSPGYYYAYVTQILGFKLGREGKVTGLAASGDPTWTLPIFLKEMSYDGSKGYLNHGLFREAEIKRLKQLLTGASREDIAAGVQRHLELMLTVYVRDMLKLYAPKLPTKLAVAGGVFANVRLNQKIAALPEVESLWIYPHMGDGGLAAGAALALLGRRGLLPQKLPHVYLGDQPDEAQIAAALVRYQDKISVAEPADLAGTVAKLLSSGKVVAVVRGAMEYGPRALGHRTLLYQATDPTVNDWLNKRLKRSEFMPFAPILLASDLPRYFTDWEKVLPSLPYMTVTVNCNRRCKKEAPAIVHVDGTARPQIVKREIEPFMYEILIAYRKLTGKRILINTSFNIHEEPIVRTSEDALKTFLDGHIDVLILGKRMITLKLK